MKTKKNQSIKITQMIILCLIVSVSSLSFLQPVKATTVVGMNISLSSEYIVAGFPVTITGEFKGADLSNYVYRGSNYWLYTSSDGITWTLINTQLNNYCFSYTLPTSISQIWFRINQTNIHEMDRGGYVYG